MEINKTIELSLNGMDGNAFMILGAFTRQAKKEDWTQEEIDQVITEAKSSDYDHLVQTIIKYTD